VVFYERIFHRKADEMKQALFFGLGPHVIRDLVPVLIVQLDALQKKQSLLIGPLVNGVVFAMCGAHWFAAVYEITVHVHMHVSREHIKRMSERGERG
jgi:hypothetical protein